MAFIEFKNVSKIYHMGEVEIKALDDISFEIEKGEFVVVLGASGAGKTTILNILGGMDTSTKGEIIIDGEDIAGYTEKQLTDYRRFDIGFVFQFYNLVQNLTAKENVDLALQISKDPLDSRTVLGMVGLKNRMNNFPSQLSGGEQQRVAIARAIANNPKYVIADEPTGNLDGETAWAIMDLLSQINRRGTTVVMVTHAADIVERMNKRVITIQGGRIISDRRGGFPNV